MFFYTPVSISLPSALCSEEQFQTTAVFADLAHLAHRANSALVFGVILGPVKRALLEGRAAVDGCVAGGADLKFGKLVELDLDCVAWVVLALRLDLACLWVVC